MGHYARAVAPRLCGRLADDITEYKHIADWINLEPGSCYLNQPESIIDQRLDRASALCLSLCARSFMNTNSEFILISIAILKYLVLGVSTLRVRLLLPSRSIRCSFIKFAVVDHDEVNFVIQTTN